MKDFLLIPLFAAVANIVLGSLVFWKNRQLQINKVFFAWCLALGIWNLGAFFLFRVDSPEAALRWARITHLGVIFLPPLFLHVTLLVTKTGYTRFLQIVYAGALIFAGVDAAELIQGAPEDAGIFIKGIRQVSFGWFARAGPAYFAFVNLFFPGVVLPALYILIRRMRRSAAYERRKFSTLLVASVMLAAFGSHDLLPVMGVTTYPGTKIPVYPWGTFAASLYGVLVAYGVLHDQILDMRVSVGRQAATILRFGFLLAIAYILLLAADLVFPSAFTLSSFIATFAILTASMGIASAFFPRLLGFSTDYFERRILGDRFEYQEQVKHFVDSLATYTEAAPALEGTADLLAVAMGLSFVGVVVLDVTTQDPQYQVQRPRTADLLASTEYVTSLFDYFRANGVEHLDCREIQLNLWTRNRARDLVARGAASIELVFRIGSKTRPTGLLLIGPRMPPGPVTSLDMELLTALANQLGFTLDRIRLAEQTAFSDRAQLLGEFSRGLAHDLNNLITPIDVYLQMMAGAHENGSDLQVLHQMAGQKISKIKSYVQEAIFFSTTHELHLVVIVISDLLKEVLETTQARGRDAGVEVKVALDPLAAQTKFVGDRVLLERMLTNLVHNAVDASDRGKVVTLRGQYVESARMKHPFVRLTVEDNGRGIDPQLLKKIYEPYFTTKTTGDRQRGFGLGLTISLRIVQLHCGKLHMSSILGRGTTARVDLPLDPIEAKKREAA